MDLTALISRFRTLSGDHGVPAFWPDEQVTGFLNEAEREACERARLLYDKTTLEATRIPLVTGQREYLLHPSVFDVEAIGLMRPGGDRSWPLCRSTDADMRWSIQHRPNLSGWGKYFFVYGDGAGRRLVIDRLPGEPGGELQLEVYRYPLQELVDPDDEPEIPPRHHSALVHWALHLAYQTRDMEGASINRAAFHEAEFIKHFGMRDDANVARKKVRHRAPVVRAQRF